MSYEFNSTEIQELLKNAQIGVWVVEYEGIENSKFYADPVMEELLGTDASMTGEERFRVYSERIHPDDMGIFLEYVDKLAKGEQTEIVYRYMHPVKGEMIVRCEGKRDYSSEDKLLIKGTHKDISTQYRLEQARRDLEHAVEVANKANAAKTAFLFNMSHDIRTPMNAIIGYTDLLTKCLDDREKTLDYIKKIQTSNYYLLSLINNVLEMSRIESGKIHLEESVWSLDQFNDTLYSVFEQEMKQKNLTFTRHVNIQHKYVFCDTTKLREIFLNIISNAYKYTEPGGTICMTLTELPSQQEGYAVYQSVIEDTGIGMSKEYLPQLFEDFSREQTTTESKIQGTGLGMPITKRLIELFGGTIEVESEVGKGSKFTVTLSHRIASEDDVKELEKSASEYSQESFKGKKILLVEDNELNQEIAQEILKQAGFEVEIAENGAVAVSMIEESLSHYYDVVLMDIQMPVMNGYEATKCIRKMQDTEKARMPIIAMTANAFEEDKQNAMNAGMNGHIAKPVSVPALMETLGSII